MGFKLVTTAQDEFAPLIVFPSGKEARDPILERVTEYFARYAWENQADPSPTQGLSIQVSAKKIADKSGISQDTVNGRVEVLIEMGVLEVIGYTENGARIMNMELQAGYSYGGFAFAPTRGKKPNREAPTYNADPTDSIDRPYLPGREGGYPPGREDLPTGSGHINGLNLLTNENPPDSPLPPYITDDAPSPSDTPPAGKQPNPPHVEREDPPEEATPEGREDEEVTTSFTETQSPTGNQSSLQSGTLYAEKIEADSVDAEEMAARHLATLKMPWTPHPRPYLAMKFTCPDIDVDSVIITYNAWCIDAGSRPSQSQWNGWVEKRQREENARQKDMREKATAERVRKRSWIARTIGGEF